MKSNKCNDPITIGTFTIENKSKISSRIFMRTSNLRLSKVNCHININPDEGDTPHFHIVSDDTSFECCLCIFEAMYFNHKKHHGFLNQDGLNSLDSFLRETSIKAADGKTTNWQYIATIWNYANPEHGRIIVNSRGEFIVFQPDYTKTCGNKFVKYGKGPNKKKK